MENPRVMLGVVVTWRCDLYVFESFSSLLLYLLLKLKLLFLFQFHYAV